MAAIGFYSTEPYFPPGQSYPPSPQGTVQDFTGYFSELSSVQTITIPESNTSPTLTPTPSPTVPEFPWLVILPLLVLVFAITAIGKYRNTTPNNY
jgi:hypothetical protein